MRPRFWVRRLVCEALVVLACGAAFNTLRAQAPQQRKYNYPPVRDQRGVIPPGPKVAPYPDPPLGDGPFLFETYEQRNIRVSVVARGLGLPWSLAFLPGGDMLVTEKAGRLRLIRNGVLDPDPVPGTPPVVSRGTMAGLMDIALHPRFAETKWIYIAYHKPMGTAVGVDGRESPLARNAILRGTWDGSALTNVKDIFVSDDVDTEATRIAFGTDGMLYMTIGGPGTGPMESLIRPQHTDDYAGKLLRMRDDGGVPPDNRSSAKPVTNRTSIRWATGTSLASPSIPTTATCGPASRARTVATRST